ncbi:transcriptional regulator [Enterococcus phoeniculicola]|jgi:DNA-binding HxlR family transcriptional regulator|uniref:Transcriptional regulator n=1 Tax=Enterococcus phoeniculicola ATCC BAA-412 TaxID=1158610 RepID=R3WE23_9ENTE|nr:helix-turn-helix domain-containing protein [Enterococcus phoeniculicola]EOL46111.1 transcriptional regulator [Enterococcus phoeniculicola ATCC BAA-412]EOT77044.1 transcriptional regulator [Enterococcus phoeniculicola ATCC BAA-412]OJG73383.1 transcriptional regulator [Enterococcus phoeniculicola]
MEQVKFDEFTLCPKFEKTFSILGKKWNGLIIDVLLENGPQRFVDLANKIPMVSDRVLVERLKELEKENIVTRNISCQESSRSEYMLTEKGADLKEAMGQLQNWSDRWVTKEECS